MDFKSIGFFFLTILILDMSLGNTAVYWFLLLVLIGMVIFRANKYTVKIDTPDIMK